MDENDDRDYLLTSAVFRVYRGILLVQERIILRSKQ